MCCVAVAAVVAQVLIWHRRSLFFLRAGLSQRAAPTGFSQAQARTDRFDAAPGRRRPLRYLPLTGDTIPIAIEFRLVASMVSSHIAHAHGVGLGTVSRA